MPDTRLKPLAKPKALKRLPGLGRREKLPPLPNLGGEPSTVTLTDDALQRLTNQLGDEALAKRVLKLQEKWPQGTVPEMIVMDFLERRRVKYEYQVWLLGGRVLKGGQVVDFVVDLGIGVMIVEVEGNYWHTRPGKAQLDEGQKMALLGLMVWGKKVRGVVEVWESRIATDNRTRRDQALNAMLQGKGLGV